MQNPKSQLKNKKVVIIGISSGIAAYKILDLFKIIKKRDMCIEVIMTPTAVKMFGREMFEKAVGKKVYTDLIDENFDYKEVLINREVEHIKLADSASVFVIAPATANVIAKLAHGLADDFLTTTILAGSAPILVCPSMNVHMWENPIVQDNLGRLKKLGYHILHPSSGQLACGYEGMGRLAEPEEIADEIFRLLAGRDKLKGKKIIVTAGGTSEPIDVVRTITNRASGKMGIAIAQECYLRGADVLLLKSVTAVEAISRQDTSGVAVPSGVEGHDSPDGGGIKTNSHSLKIEIFETSTDLERLIKKHIKEYDALFHTAAVSDFIPEKQLDTKLNSDKSLTLNLKPSPKIINKIKFWNPKIKLIGFKAVCREIGEKMVNSGMEKLKDSRSDYIVVNDIGKEGIGFGADDNEVYIVSTRGLELKIERTSKKEVAEKIINFIFLC